ncbi:MAG: hypothetical protein LUH14_13240 [Clostridiaceae bacterium]|nr:hypothetical protein [Clostridiaceae bacterium]
MIKECGSEEIQRKYISKIHYNGLTSFINDMQLIVAFRPAGIYSIDKLELGAAAKPHTILAKSIKPCDLDLAENQVMFSSFETITEKENKETNMVKSFLCGLVGYREPRKITYYNKTGICGLYLSPIGAEEIQDVTILKDGQNMPYVYFEGLDELLAWVYALLDINDYKCGQIARYFVTGDYDMHEILTLNKKNEYVHIESDSDSESELLCAMSNAAMRECEELFPQANIKPSKIEEGRFVPNPFSPIQHGAQDNYLAHNFKEEKEAINVAKVALPALDVAIYNGITQTWTVINNEFREYDQIMLYMKQSEEMSEYFRQYNGEVAEHWKFQSRGGSEQIEMMQVIDRSYRDIFQSLRDLFAEDEQFANQ